MCRRADAIDCVSAAADRLTRVCVQHAYAVDTAIAESPHVVALRRRHRPNFMTPTDMVDTLRKIK